MGALRPFFGYGRSASVFCFVEVFMKKKVRILTQSAALAAVYVVLCHLQNLLFPNSASFAIQFRLAEALCVFAFFTPAGIYGLSLGCLLFNLTSGSGLPLDLLIGTAATILATAGMWLTKKITLKGYPLPGLLLPALANGFLVGWELWLYIGGGFWYNVICVALGEAAVLLLPGSGLYYLIKRTGPQRLGIQ
jgi:uncharacterized membrane protein